MTGYGFSRQQNLYKTTFTRVYAPNGITGTVSCPDGLIRSARFDVPGQSESRIRFNFTGNPVYEVTSRDGVWRYAYSEDNARFEGASPVSGETAVRSTDHYFSEIERYLSLIPTDQGDEKIDRSGYEYVPD